MKKGVELSVQTMIIVVLGLLVLGLLVYLVVKAVIQANEFTECPSSADCVPEGSTCGLGKIPNKAYTCSEGLKCCVGLGT